MLIKQSIVEKWYQRDSWVYKNFAYLFQNPLWNKKIPNGFSVCPYFWMNLFSLFIFRPFFVFPIAYCIMPIMKFIGKPAYAIDKFLYKTISRHFLSEIIGAGFLGLGLAVVMALMLGFLMLVIGSKIVDISPQLFMTQLGTFVFWSAASFLSLFGIIGIHKLCTKTECKTMNYLYVWVAGFILSAAIFIPSFLLNASSKISIFLWDRIVLIGHYLGFGLSYAAKGVWWFLNFSPIPYFHLPWWGFLVAFGAIGYIATIIIEKIETKNRAAIIANANDASFNIDSWVNVLLDIINSDSNWKFFTRVFSIRNIMWKHESPFFYEKALEVMKNKLIRAAIMKHNIQNLDAWSKTYPMLKRKSFSTLLKQPASVQFKQEELHNSLFVECPNINLNEDVLLDIILGILHDDTNPITIQINEYANLLKKQDDLDAKNKQFRKNGWAHQTCLKVTMSIGNNVKKLKTTTWNCMLQLWTFLVYLWMLVKAKKQGACPYFCFSDNTPQAPKK